jgi:glutaredoxin
MTVKHVDGKDKGHILLYALSTCGWCKKTKRLLGDLGVAYDYIDVDNLTDTHKTATIEKIKKWNPQCTFPTLVIHDTQCIIGYKEDEIKKLLGP